MDEGVFFSRGSASPDAAATCMSAAASASSVSASAAAIRALVASSACLAAYNMFVLARRVRDLQGGSPVASVPPSRSSGDGSYVHFRESIPFSVTPATGTRQHLWTADRSLGWLASKGSVSTVEMTYKNEVPGTTLTFETAPPPGEDDPDRTLAQDVLRQKAGAGSIVTLVSSTNPFLFLNNTHLDMVVAY